MNFFSCLARFFVGLVIFSGTPQAQANPLDHLGYIDSEELGCVRSRCLYRGYVALNNGERFPRFVMVHDIGREAEIVPLVHLGPEWGWRLSGEDPLLVQHLLPGMIDGEYIQPEIIHYVVGEAHPYSVFPNSRTTFNGAEYPMMEVKYGLDVDGRRIIGYSGYQSHRLPENTVAGINARWEEGERRSERIDAFRAKHGHPAGLLEAIREAHRYEAEVHGYLYLEPSYWAPIFDRYQAQARQPLQRLNLVDVFNRGIPERMEPVQLIWPFMRYVNNLSDQCAESMGPSITGRISTTQTTRHSDGRPNTKTLVRTQEIKIPARFADLYSQHFRRFDDFARDSGRYFVIDGIADLFQGSNRGNARLANRLVEMWAVDHVFQREACDSDVIWQLGHNLAAGLRGTGSVSQLRINSTTRQVPEIVPESLEPAVLHADFNSADATATFTILSAPKGWLPEPPNEIYAAVVEELGTDRFSQNFGPALVSPNVYVVVLEPAPRSLKEMRISRLEYLGGNAHKLGELFGSDNLLWSSITHTREKVALEPKVLECLYQGGTHLYFWHEFVPEVASPEALAARKLNHPLLQVRAPVANCPAENTN